MHGSEGQAAVPSTIRHLPFEQVLRDLPPGVRRLEIQYAVLNRQADRNPIFRYRLEGDSPDWIETSLAQAQAAVLAWGGDGPTLVLTDVMGATPANVAQKLVQEDQEDQEEEPPSPKKRSKHELQAPPPGAAEAPATPAAASARNHGV